MRSSAVLVVSILTVIAVVGAAFVSLIVRYRYAGRDERQQIKWLAFVAALALVSQAVAFASLVACGCDNSPVANVAFIGTEVAAFIGIPAAITIAILRYRLYDIDLIINRALVYGLIATALTAIYVGVVVGVGALVGSSGSSTLTIVAAVAIALLFQPLRRRAQRLANRLVYGDRATPYQVLSDFAERMAGTYALDDVLERMASILADGTGATRVDVWLRVGGELRPVAAWPADAPGLDPIALAAGDALPAFDMTRAVAVRHGAELFGAMTLIKPRNEPLTPTEDKLVEDLASQAGLVLRNARLAAELQESVDALRASRRRLVEAQDEERRKIERNLHDGAQQQLVALSVQLGLLRASGGRSRTRAADGDPAPGWAPRRARRPPRPRARHLPAAARRQGPGRGARGAGVERPRCRRRSSRTGSAATRGRSRRPSTSARSRRCRTSRSTRTRVRRRSGSPSATGASSSRSRTTAAVSTRMRQRSARACRGWRIVWTRSGGRSISGARRAKGPVCAARSSWTGALATSRSLTHISTDDQVGSNPCVRIPWGRRYIRAEWSSWQDRESVLDLRPSGQGPNSSKNAIAASTDGRSPLRS